jgi:EpsD family peptidyl-prolyl cis-trans isomerase
MTPQLSSCRRFPLRPADGRGLALAVAVGVVLLAGCDQKPPATQTAAKVNKEEITVDQIDNALTPQQRALPADEAASASRQVLEGLIDKELAVQKASDQKLDRDPRVVQRIEAARREIIARAYGDKVSEGAPKPTSAELEAYYQAHPELFAERRVYNLQEVTTLASPEQVEALKKVFDGSKSFAEFIAYLTANNIKFTGGEAVRAAEQLPPAVVDQFAKMKEGEAISNYRPGGLQVVNIAAARSEPVTFDNARPAIEQLLLSERKRKLIADDVTALRAAAHIEYMGDFAKDAPPPRPVSVPEPLTTLPPTRPASDATATPQIEVPPIEAQAASTPNTETVERGIKGMK